MSDRSIRFSMAESALGLLLVAVGERGACSVRLGASAEELLAGLRAQLRTARIERDDSGLAAWIAAALELARGVEPGVELPLDLPAGGFRRRVWDALREIPRGRTRTYAEVARSLGRPRAARAVGQACAANPLALLVPCHRVVPAAGGSGGYRWGPERKRALLHAESERCGALRDRCRDPAAAR
jgi:AraC family transcriptional regulator of adaptative response/methylated-DNA-[protein]-cysteine methyltransferase